MGGGDEGKEKKRKEKERRGGDKTAAVGQRGACKKGGETERRA